MGTNPSEFQGDNLPVEGVSWNEAVKFCRKLSQMTGRKYRLPSEAEWEYACRAGTSGPYAGNLDEMAWYGNNAGRQYIDADAIWRTTDESNYKTRIVNNGNQTHPVGSKQPNSFGLFDMHGNVWEWCEDWYHNTYAGAPTDGSAWLSGGRQEYRMLRGGSWGSGPSLLRSAYRVRDGPDRRFIIVGFRVVALART
jgi:formylglycine-generating enzyme required for sulfatase activity